MYPGIVQNVIFPLHERLKSKPTLEYSRELEGTQWLSTGGLRELQFQRLCKFLAYAYQEVPYYTKLFDAHGQGPKKIHSLEDLSRIPCLTREDLRRYFIELQPKRKMSGLKRISTGGSTGMPVTVMVDRERAAFTDAVRLRAHRWFGVDMGVREIALWGSPIELGRQDRVRNIRDWLMNSRLLSAFDLGDANVAAYTRFISRFRPQKMYGYASAFYLMAQFHKTSRWRPPQELKVIFATAEPLFDFQRRLVEQVFECPVAIEYGARDAGLMANECPKGGLHIPVEGMLIEIDSPDERGCGEIIVTNLFSRAMPIIRYRTGDRGVLDPEPCPCGRGLPRLKKVEGRQTDFLVTPSGRVIHALAIIYVLREISKVKEFQVTQETLDEVVIRVVMERSLSQDERSSMATRAQMALGKDMKIVVEEVGAIPRLNSGKFRYVISKVAEERLGKTAINATSH